MTKKEHVFEIPTEVSYFVKTLCSDIFNVFAEGLNTEDSEDNQQLFLDLINKKVEGYVLDLIYIQKKEINASIKRQIDKLDKIKDKEEISKLVKQSAKQTEIATLLEGLSDLTELRVDLLDELYAMYGDTDDQRVELSKDRKVKKLFAKLKNLSVKKIISNHRERNEKRQKIKYSREQIEILKNSTEPGPAFHDGNILYQDYKNGQEEIYYAVRNVSEAHILQEGKDENGHRRHCIADENQRYSKIIDRYDSDGYPAHACFSIRKKKGNGPEVKVFTIWYDRENFTITQIKGDHDRLLTDINSPEGYAVLNFIRKFREEYSEELPLDTIRDLREALNLQDGEFLVFNTKNKWEKKSMAKYSEQEFLLMGRLTIDVGKLIVFGVDKILKLLENKNIDFDFDFKLLNSPNVNLEKIFAKILETSNRKLAKKILDNITENLKSVDFNYLKSYDIQKLFFLLPEKTRNESAVSFLKKIANKTGFDRSEIVNLIGEKFYEFLIQEVSKNQFLLEQLSQRKFLVDQAWHVGKVYKLFDIKLIIDNYFKNSKNREREMEYLFDEGNFGLLSDVISYDNGETFLKILSIEVNKTIEYGIKYSNNRLYGTFVDILKFFMYVKEDQIKSISSGIIDVMENLWLNTKRSRMETGLIIKTYAILRSLVEDKALMLLIEKSSTYKGRDLFKLIIHTVMSELTGGYDFFESKRLLKLAADNGVEIEKNEVEKLIKSLFSYPTISVVEPQLRSAYFRGINFILNILKDDREKVERIRQVFQNSISINNSSLGFHSIIEDWDREFDDKNKDTFLLDMFDSDGFFYKFNLPCIQNQLLANYIITQRKEAIIDKIFFTLDHDDEKLRNRILFLLDKDAVKFLEAVLILKGEEYFFKLLDYLAKNSATSGRLESLLPFQEMISDLGKEKLTRYYSSRGIR